MAGEVLSSVVDQFSRTPSVPRPKPGATASAERQIVSPEGGKLPALAAKRELTRDEVKEVVSNLNEFVQTLRRDLSFTVDENSGQTVIKVIDSETERVIRQIPPQEVLEVARRLAESSGAILQAEV